ncbi:MAG: hypothetical protein ACJ74R_13140 [Gaiellaceae bacterium]
MPTVDIHTVGAGGGSLVWRDAGGALRRRRPQQVPRRGSWPDAPPPLPVSRRRPRSASRVAPASPPPRTHP